MGYEASKHSFIIQSLFSLPTFETFEVCPSPTLNYVFTLKANCDLESPFWTINILGISNHYNQ